MPLTKTELSRRRVGILAAFRAGLSAPELSPQDKAQAWATLRAVRPSVRQRALVLDAPQEPR